MVKQLLKTDGYVLEQTTKDNSVLNYNYTLHIMSWSIYNKDKNKIKSFIQEHNITPIVYDYTEPNNTYHIKLYKSI